jgi:hypothetical protein
MPFMRNRRTRIRPTRGIRDSLLSTDFRITSAGTTERWFTTLFDIIENDEMITPP